jgi:hypothetical protein
MEKAKKYLSRFWNVILILIVLVMALFLVVAKNVNNRLHDRLEAQALMIEASEFDRQGKDGLLVEYVKEDLSKEEVVDRYHKLNEELVGKYADRLKQAGVTVTGETDEKNLENN